MDRPFLSVSLLFSFLTGTALMSIGCVTAPRLPSIAALRTTTAPASQDAALTTAMQLERSGRFAEARQQYQQLTAQNPGYAQAWHRLAVVATIQQDDAAAAQAFQQALKLAPQDPELLADAAYALYVRKEYATAQQFLERALAANPQHRRATNNLGLVQGMIGQPDVALATFEKIHPRPQALMNLSYVHQLRGEWDLALAANEQAHALDPSIVIAPQLLSRTQKAAAELAAAIPPSPAPLATALEPVAPAPVTLASSGPVTIPVSAAVAVAGWNPPSPETSATAIELPAAPLFPVESAPAATDEVEFIAPVTIGNDSPSEPVVTDDLEAPATELEPATWTPTRRPDAASAPIGSSVPPERLLPEPAAPAAPKVSAAAVPVLLQALPPLLPQALPIVQPAWTSKPRPEQAKAVVVMPVPVSSQLVVPIVAAPIDETEVFVLPQPSQHRLQDVCLVTLLDRREWCAADPQFAVVFQEQAYCFSSQAAADRFRAEPERYVPAAGGLDVIGVRSGTEITEGDLQFAVWYRQRLYLFSSAEHLEEFRREPLRYVPTTVAVR